MEAPVTGPLCGQFSAQYFDLGPSLTFSRPSRIPLNRGELNRTRHPPALDLSTIRNLASLTLSSRNRLSRFCFHSDQTLLSFLLSSGQRDLPLMIRSGQRNPPLVLGGSDGLLLLAVGGRHCFPGQLFRGGQGLACVVFDCCGAFCFASQLYFGGLACGDGILSLLPGGSQSFRGFQCLSRRSVCPLDGLGPLLGGALCGGDALPGPVFSARPGFLGSDSSSLGLSDLGVSSLDSSHSSRLNLIQPRGHSIECGCQCVYRPADRAEVLPQPLRIQPEGAASGIQPERSQRLPLSPRHLRTGPPALPPRIPAETPRPPALQSRPRQLRAALAVSAPSSILTHAREPRS